MGNQDRGYKLLFSNKEIVRDLLTRFVDPEIVKELDLCNDKMVREHSDFITDDLRERIDDIIWRVNFGAGYWPLHPDRVPVRRGPVDGGPAYDLHGLALRRYIRRKNR